MSAPDSVRRLRRLARTLVPVLALAAGGGVAGAIASTPHRAARLLVYAQEWSLWSSQARIHHGPVIVELWNRGEDAHDLRIRHLNRHGKMWGHPQRVKVTVSGALSQTRWHLAPGRYELYCSMPGHLARGMHTVLVVR